MRAVLSFTVVPVDSLYHVQLLLADELHPNGLPDITWTTTFLKACPDDDEGRLRWLASVLRIVTARIQAGVSEAIDEPEAPVQPAHVAAVAQAAATFTTLDGTVSGA